MHSLLLSLAGSGRADSPAGARRPRRRRVPALLALLLLACAARAHDFWILPSSFTPAVGAELGMRLFVGDGPGDAEPYARNPPHLRRFVLLGPGGGPGGEVAVTGSPGADPAGLVTSAHPGLHVLAYESRGSFIELAPEKFEAYLREEGLEHIVALRTERAATQQPGRELYVRCAKSLLRVGDAPAEGFDRLAGLPCEIVPEVDPTALTPGETGAELPLRVLAQGRPAAGLRVDAISLDDPTRTAQVRTDEQGRAVLRLPAGGRWMLATVHMAPASPDGKPVDGEDFRGNPVHYDWRSAWASLTFATR